MQKGCVFQSNKGWGWKICVKDGQLFITHFFTISNKRVKETAAELTNLQSQLADYNLLVDKLNTDTEVILVQQEAQEMAAQNESESREVEALFAEKQNCKSSTYEVSFLRVQFRYDFELLQVLELSQVMADLFEQDLLEVRFLEVLVDL